MSSTPSERAGKPDDIVVFVVTREAVCSECGEELHSGNLLRVEKEKALCMDCADLGHLEFLASGDAALTRRASKHSTLKAVVVKWSRARKRYERQGTLVEPEALAKAEAECVADAPQRAARRAEAAMKRDEDDREFIADFARAIREQFPGCPAEAANKIAAHACQKYSGRVGRSAAAKDFDTKAVRLAVIAHVRHVHTEYDRLLGSGWDRYEAREHVSGKIEGVMARWEKG